MYRSSSMAACEPSFEGQLPLQAAALLLLFAASREQGRLQPGVAVTIMMCWPGHGGAQLHDWDTAALIQAACSHCVKLAPGNRNIMMVTSISPFTRASLHFHHASKAFLPDVKIEIPRTAGKKELRISNPGSLKVRMSIRNFVHRTTIYTTSTSLRSQQYRFWSKSSSKFSLVIKSQLGRPQADHDNQLGAPASKTNDVFLRYMDGLSPTSCRYVVHYKEAVRERQRMRLFTTYWELEETNRLCALLTSLYAEADLEFHRAELESQVLLQALVTKQSLSRSAADVEYLTATRQCNKTSLRETDAQLDLLKDHLQQRQSTHKLDDTSNCAADSQIIADD
ncbi:hypothetical protein F4604DRAFT_1689230 [Suillus subluteus]|nr:hypothetical protein F4604DRAFT_1689230 [Suillus subluteus]